MAPSAPAPAAAASTACPAAAASTSTASHSHSEPKAPDKSAPPPTTAGAAHDQENKHLETLDDGALRALLDEAITYKSPKDREGKSSLFKELLEEAEQDEVECETSGAGSSGSWRSGRESRGGRRPRRGERLPHSGSLQDLVAAALADVTDSAPHAPPGARRHAPVSARTRHGGSLPSGVDRSFLMGEEPVRGGGADYIATVRCVNPPPLTERRVSVSDAHNATEMVHLNQRSKIPCIPVTYTSRASLEIGSAAVSGGRALTTTTCSNQVRMHPRAPPSITTNDRIPSLQPKGQKLGSVTKCRPKRRRVKKTKEDRYNFSTRSASILEDGPSSAVLENTIIKKNKCTSFNSSVFLVTMMRLKRNVASDKERADQMRHKLFLENLSKYNFDSIGESVYDLCNVSSGSYTNRNSPDVSKYNESLNSFYNDNATKKQYFTKDNFSSRTRNENVGVNDTKIKKDDGNFQSPVLRNIENASKKQDSSFCQHMNNTENPFQRFINQHHYKANSFKQYAKCDNELNHKVAELYDGRSTAVFRHITAGPPERLYAPRLPSHPSSSNDFDITIRPRFVPLSKLVERKQQKLDTRICYVNKESSLDSTGNTDNSSNILSSDDSLESVVEDYPPKCSVQKSNWNFNETSWEYPKDSYEIPQFLSPSLKSEPIWKTTIGAPSNLQNSLYSDGTNTIETDAKRKNILNYLHNKENNGIPEQDFFLNSIVNIADKSTGADISRNKGAIDNANNHTTSSVTQIIKNDSIETIPNCTQILCNKKKISKKVYADKQDDDVISFYPGMTDNDFECALKHLVTPSSVQAKLISSQPDILQSQGNTETITKHGINFVEFTQQEFGSSINTEFINNQDLLEEVVPHNSSTIQDTLDNKPTDNEYPSTNIQNMYIYNPEKSDISMCVNDFESDYNFEEGPGDVPDPTTDVQNVLAVSATESSELIVSHIKNNQLEKEIKSHQSCIDNPEQSEQKVVPNIMLKIDTKEITHGKKKKLCTEKSENVPEYSSEISLIRDEIYHMEANEENIDISCVLKDEDNQIEDTENQIINQSAELDIDAGEDDDDVISFYPDMTDEDFENAVKQFDSPRNTEMVHGLEDPNGALIVDLGNNLKVSSKTEFVKIDSSSTTELVKSGKQLDLLKSTQIPDIDPTQALISVDTLLSSLSSETSFYVLKTTEQVDSGITFGCITTPAVVTSCSSTSSAPVTSATADTKPRGALANGLAGISRASYGTVAAAACPVDEFKKSLDENGNALTFNSPLSGSSQHKKPRRKKSSKNETVAMSEQIDGYQGNKEINELLRFIESNAEHGRQGKSQLSRIKHGHDEDKGCKKRSTERRIKDKSDSKIKRANSMEELSLTKLEDLTHEKGRAEGATLRKNKKERVSDGGAPAESRKSERRSWGDESRDAHYHSNSEEPPTGAPVTSAREKKKTKQNKSAESLSAHAQEVHADPPAETLEFQTVTKKKRTRKRHSPHDDARDGASVGGGDRERGDTLYRKLRTPNSPERRRKSAPPSDKSNDSNDDLDSVHSLPAEPTAERCAVRPASASSGGTPQASYADIARTRHNIPDLIESCNFYTDLEPASEVDEKIYKKKETVCRSESAPVEMRKSLSKTAEPDPGPAYDAENYPALEMRGHRTLPRMKEKQTLPPAQIRQIERRPKPHMETVTAIEQRITRISPKAPIEGTEGVEEDCLHVTVIPVVATSDPPDVVLAPDRRPPVILLDEAARPRDMDGITFGFDINEQLLNGEHREPQAAADPVTIAYRSNDEFPAINEKRSRARGCDLVRDTMSAGAVLVRVGRAPPLRYLPPAPAAERHSGELEKIVNYVGSAWEDIIKCPGGKVRYFSE